MRRLVAPAALFAFAAVAPAQETKPKADSKPTVTAADWVPAKADGPPEFDAKLADGSVVKLTLLEPSVTVATKYGKLTVPAADLRRVEVGFRYPPGTEAKADKAAADLGSAAFRAREEAERTLLALNEYALPALRKAVKSSDPEVVRRAEGLLKTLQDKLPTDRQTLRGFDVVETVDFTIHGQVEAETLQAKTRYFGDAKVRVAELRGLTSLRSLVGVKELAVDAGKYGMANDQSWFDTGIDLPADYPVDVSASGTIDLYPQQPGRYTSGPAGSANQGAGPGILGPNGQQFRYNPGTLVGRIGDGGAAFVIGGGYKVPRPPAGGRLYLKVAPSNWGTPSTGSYTVKVKVG